MSSNRSGNSSTEPAGPPAAVNTRTIYGRAALAGLAALVLLFVWFSVRWQLGSMLGELTPVSQGNAAQVADVAMHLAPGDPRSAWLAAAKQKEDFSPDSMDKTVAMLEHVIRLSPNDYRWWIELGRAYEQAERQDDAERAFRRAVELAPEYSFPRWQIGNFYLRQDRVDEAFAELRRSTEKSIAYREQVFSLAWDYFQNDPAQVERVAADRPDVKATLASFYAQRGHPTEALWIWNSMSDEEKSPHVHLARDIAQGLHDRLHFREAVEFARQTGIDPEAQAETISNAGFEKFLGQPDDTLFGWRVDRGQSRMDISSDSSVRSEGARGLKVTFRAFAEPEIYNIIQFVAAEPGGRYRLSFMLRTENLRSGGPPLLRVTAGKESRMLAATAPFPTGTNDWQQVTLDFTVPADAEGFAISTGRTYCDDGCPITGTFWYDDFRLAKM